jgi:hypothetical protein
VSEVLWRWRYSVGRWRDVEADYRVEMSDRVGENEGSKDLILMSHIKRLNRQDGTMYSILKGRC